MIVLIENYNSNEFDELSKFTAEVTVIRPVILNGTVDVLRDLFTVSNPKVGNILYSI